MNPDSKPNEGAPAPPEPAVPSEPTAAQPAGEPNAPAEPAPASTAAPSEPAPPTDPTPSTGAPPASDPPPKKDAARPDTVTIVFGVVVVLLGVIGFLMQLMGWGPNQAALSVSAFERPDPKNPKVLRVTGVAKVGDVPAEGVTVWLEGLTRRGDRQAYPPATSDEKGNFVFEGVAAEVMPDVPINEFRLSATDRHRLLPNKTASNVWRVGPSDGTIPIRDLGFSIWYLVPLFAFVSSLCWVAHRAYTGARGRGDHMFPAALALLSTAFMIGLLGYGLMWVNDRLQPGKAASVGFITFYHGSYVKGGTNDWLISFTSPPERPPTTPQPPGAPAPVVEPPLANGFGAPLWVVFVAVLGSGLLTGTLVLRQLIRPLPTQDDKIGGYRGRLRNLLEHHFYVLVAPFSGVVLYQLMLVGGAAGQPVVVAMTALGAGAALNGILVRAVQAAEEWGRGKKKEDEA